MNLDDPVQKAKTEALLDTLLKQMDPATAKLVYAGCLVGSNPVPLNKSASAAAHIAGTPSLATFTEQRGAALGLKPGFTQAARASVGLSGSKSLMDASGNMGVQYEFDPTAYGDALTYVATGHEPEGLFRAAVEVAATAGPVVAETQLRTRLKTGISAKHGWYDQTTIALVQVALDGVAAGAGVSVEKLNMLAHMAGPPFLVGVGDGYGRTVGSLVSAVNSQPLAIQLYERLGIMPHFTAPPYAPMHNARFLIDQAWLGAGGARAAPMIAWLDATPTATRGYIASRLSVPTITAASSVLFAPGALASVGRIRLALAWLQADASNGDVNAFLLTQVLKPATGPEFTAAVKAQLDGAGEDELLEKLGVVSTTPVVPPGGGAAVELPSANAQVRKGKGNEIRIEPHPFSATVLPFRLNVRSLPGMHGKPFDVVKRGDVLPAAGFTHDWVAVDHKGKLGFVLGSKVSGA
jgi:hypothetical protein